jgi:hypothetical protein
MSERAQILSRRGNESGLAKLIEDGPYFTDGVRLFRLTGVVSGSSGPKLVQLEDCRTLAVSEYTEEEVELFGFVPVSARPTGQDGSGRRSVSAPGHDQHGCRARAHQA